jgi:hypothetical protein
MFMIFVFIFKMLLFSYFGSISVQPMECILYVICLWICGYYCWKFLNEEKKYHKLAYVFLSNIMFSFVIICKWLDLYVSNL